MVVHILSIGLTGFYMYLSSPGTDLFSWHPTCMSVAFILLLLQAIVIFSPESSLTPSTPRPDKVQLHWILHCFGIVSALFGFGTVYLNKELNNRKHFTTWHGKVGLATLVGSLLTMLGGIMANYSVNLKKYIRPLNMKLYHATAGLLIFTLAMVACVLATYSNYFTKRVKIAWLSRIIMWAPIVLAVCIARQVTQSYVPRVCVQKDSALDAKAKKVEEKIKAKLNKSTKSKDQ